MTAIVISAPGGPEMLVAAERPLPVPGAGEILDQGRRGRREPPRHHAASRPVSAASRRADGDSRARGRRRGRGARRRRVAVRARRQRSAPSFPAPAMPNTPRSHETNALPVPRGFSIDRGGGDPRDLLHDLADHHRTRPARAGRDHPHPWRRVRRRHQRHPAREGLRRPRHRHRRQRRRSARPAASSAPTSRSTTGPRISSPS